MAADNRDKRFSFLGFNMPVPAMMPDPDGSDWATTLERSQGLWLYAGISIQAAQPTMRRWGGIPYVRMDKSYAGRSW